MKQLNLLVLFSFLIAVSEVGRCSARLVINYSYWKYYTWSLACMHASLCTISYSVNSSNYILLLKVLLHAAALWSRYQYIASYLQCNYNCICSYIRASVHTRITLTQTILLLYRYCTTMRSYPAYKTTYYTRYTTRSEEYNCGWWIFKSWKQCSKLVNIINYSYS